MFLKCLQVGVLASNCYILGDEKNKKAVIIDPGGNAEDILSIVKKEGFTVDLILLTHGHADHIGGLEEVRCSTGARVAIHENDAPMLLSPGQNLSEYMGTALSLSPAEIKLKGGDEKLSLGDLTLEVIHTPGHTPGSISIKVGNIIFTGDTLFAGSIGRSDFPGGSFEQLMESIKNKLLIQDDDVIICPGHGIKSTIKQEKDTNPFLR
ncbi:MAG: hydroxyacylglutathione hydrolase [Thermoanaerobacteraceae bacterium]|nr:hydroxyacylglutathione hydrolase [Thermoanaerobacteraceae bacterium]